MSSITDRRVIFWKVRDIILSELHKLRDNGKLTASDDNILQDGSAIMKALGFGKEELELMGEISSDWRANPPDPKP